MNKNHSMRDTKRKVLDADDGDAQLAKILDEKRKYFTTQALPEEVDVVIIGGGIVGCSAAYFLNKLNMRVALFEKHRVGCEQSGRNWGWVRQQGRAEAELPMMIRSRAIWQQWVETLGENTGFKQGGCLYLAKTDQELEQHEPWIDIARRHQLESHIVRGKALDDVLSGGAKRWAGALYTPSDARAEPGIAVPAIARAAIREGVVINEQCAVRGLETSAGQVSAVVTERGRVKTNHVVCAAGAWTSLFAGSLGITVPQLKLKGTVARTAPAAAIIHGTAWAPDIAIRRRDGGGYTIAHGSAMEHAIVPASFRFARRFAMAAKHESNALRLRLNGEFISELAQAKRWSLDKPTVFEKNRMLDPQPAPRMLKELQAALAISFPEISDAPIKESWAGMIEASPDLIPIIGPTKQLPGFYLATGFSGHGFGLGPGAGECIADMIVNQANTRIDLSPFRPGRYFDGSKLEFGPAV